MSKEQLIRKLTSRKFILTVVMLIFGILCITEVIPVDLQEKWKEMSVIAAGIIAYILSEGATDIAGILKENKGDVENGESDNDE